MTRSRKRNGKAVTPGIYRDRKGYRAFVEIADASTPTGIRTKTKRFPISAALTEMKDWREEQRVKARILPAPRPTTGSFAEDVAKYLKQVAAMPTIAWRRRDLAQWTEAFGDVPRSEITSADIRAQLHKWRTEGPIVRFSPKRRTWKRIAKPLSASACNHRRTALLHLYTILDGKDAPNPVRAIPAFDEPAPEPRHKPIAFIISAIGRIRAPKSRARAKVLLWCGMRGNSELGKMKAEHVDLKNAVCHIPTGKGGRRFRNVPLPAPAIEAWKEFIALKCWGAYDKNALAQSVAVACQRQAKADGVELTRPMRPYDLRHSLATAYLKSGADLADVQELLGHSTPRMTRRYAPFQIAKLAAVAAKIIET